jgi:hypothetical protein
MKQRKDFEESQRFRNISREVLDDWELERSGPYKRLKLIVFKLGLPLEDPLTEDERKYLAKGINALIESKPLNKAFEINLIKTKNLREHYERWLAVEKLRDTGFTKEDAIDKVAKDLKCKSRDTIEKSFMQWKRFVLIEAPECFPQNPKKGAIFNKI